MKETQPIPPKKYSIILLQTPIEPDLDTEILSIIIGNINNSILIEKHSITVKPTIPINDILLVEGNLKPIQLENANSLENVMSKALNIIGDNTIITHQATYEILQQKCKELGLELNNSFIDIKEFPLNLFDPVGMNLHELVNCFLDI